MSIARDIHAASTASGVGTAPFEAGPDPRFLYPHVALQRVCAELLAFDLSQRPGLFVITGAAGTGKSALLQSILEDRRLGERCLALSCAGGLSFEALVEAWCAALGIAREVADHEARRSALGAHLAAKGPQVGTVALLLDDAEALQDGDLAALCDFATSRGAEHRLARIVLSGRPGLEAKLACPEHAALGQAIACQTRLEAMAEPEVEAYIRHRLAAAGHETPDELFSAQAVEIVARASVGVPRVVNILCRTALEIASAAGRPTVSPQQIESAIQACLLHAQDSLAASDPSPPPRIAAAGAGTVMVAGPGPPRPDARWPIVVEIETAADGVARTGTTPRRRWPRKFLRSTPGLLVGLVFGLAIVTLYPGRLEMPEAVAPGLLLSAEDDKAQPFEIGPNVLDPPVDRRAPETEPAVTTLEPPVEVRDPGAEPAVPAPELLVETRAPGAKPNVLVTGPPVEMQEPVAESAVTTPEPPVEARRGAAEPAVLVPKPPFKPRLLRTRPEASGARGKAAMASPSSGAPDAVTEARKQERGPASWLDKLADLFSSAAPPQDARRFGQQPDR